MVLHTSRHGPTTRSHHQHLSWTTNAHQGDPTSTAGLTACNYPAVSTLALLVSCFQLMSYQCIAEVFVTNPHVRDLTLHIAELHQGQAILPVLYHNVQQRVYRRSKDGINTNIGMKILQKIRCRIYP